MAQLAELQRELIELDRQLAEATNNVGHSETNPQAFAHLQKFRQTIASQIAEQIDPSMIRDKILSTIDVAEATTQPSGPIRAIAKSVITLGIILQVTGLLFLNQSRHQNLST